jgi:uncharacterized protein
MKKNTGNIFFLGVTAVIILILIYSFSGEQFNEEYVKEIQKFRDNKNQMLKSSEESPLDRKQKKQFDSLFYFPINPTYRIQAELVKLPINEIIEIGTTGNKPRRYKKYALAHFQLGNQKHELVLLQATDRLTEALHKNTLFLPFTDSSSGDETYGGGRYLDIELTEEKTITLDFNMAYNPYCAYNSTYDCPIPPKENNLSIKILAGEKKFELHN